MIQIWLNLKSQSKIIEPNDFIQRRILISGSEKDLPKLRVWITDSWRNCEGWDCGTKRYLWGNDPKHLSLCAIKNRLNKGYWKPLTVFFTQALLAQSQRQALSLQKLPILESQVKSMLHFPKISITTHLTRHSPLTTDQAHHGHSQSVLRHPIPKRKVIRQEADRITTLNAHDRVSTDQGQGEQVGYAVFSSWGEGLVPGVGLSGQGKKGCVRKLGVQVCDSLVDGCDCAGAF